MSDSAIVAFRFGKGASSPPRDRSSSISRTPINPQDLPQGSAQTIQSQAQSTEPLYRVAVRMDKTHITAYGEQVPLKPGMAVEADVLQDRRAIWEWVLEPVIAARTNLRGTT